MKRVFTQTFGVAGAILEKDGKILLVKEAKKDHPDYGKWNHPAGWIDIGENPAASVRREVLEETGFIFNPKHILGIYSLVRGDIAAQLGATPHAIKIIYTGEISDKKPKTLADDISEARWFTPGEIYAMDQKTLRDEDIKQMVRDLYDGRRFPLNILAHTVSR